jgi:hypothetical protein
VEEALDLGLYCSTHKPKIGTTTKRVASRGKKGQVRYATKKYGAKKRGVKKR